MTAPSSPSTSGPPSTVAAREPLGAKPRWRGFSHLVAFYVSLVLGPVLVVEAGTTTARVTAAIYAASLVALFGCSALLHRNNWSEAAHPWFRRLDHSMIFVFIAGTYTPISAIALTNSQANLVLFAVWLAAAAGVLVTVFWINAPRWVTSACYLLTGWIAVVALPALWSALGVVQFSLLVLGGVLYSLGAVVYARKRPDPSPEVFGYHEVFHALVIAAVICHYVLITNLVRT